MSGITISTLAIVAGLSLVALLLFRLAKIARTRQEEVLAMLEDETLLAATRHANCFGLESLGMTQTRGNGILALTQTRLAFGMLVPRRFILVPLERIQNVESVRWHLGKGRLKPLVKVTFLTENNKVDSVAWLLGDTSRWIEQIKNAVAQRTGKKLETSTKRL